MGGCSIGTSPFESDLDPFHRDEFAEAQGSVDYSVLSGEFMSRGSVLAFAVQPFPIEPPFLDSDRFSRASVFLTLDLTAWSGGPLRPGMIELLVLHPDVSSPGVTDAFFVCQVGTLFDGELGFCPSGTFPFTLGRSFAIHLGLEAHALDSGVSGLGHQPADFIVSFRLTELDGTPVDVELFPVPEPSTFLLLASALPFLVIKRMGLVKGKSVQRRCEPTIGNSTI
jgi:hypothetical protein